MRRRGASVRSVAVAAATGFVAGATVVALLVWRVPALTGRATSLTVSDECGKATFASQPPAASDPEEPLPTPTPTEVSRLGVDPIAELRDRRLVLPIAGVERDALHGSFAEKRGAHLHEAIDILAPRETPVVGVEGGTIAKLFYSKAGGITVYQFDPTSTYVYYYAHLDRYAPGLKEGDRVTRGQVLGYVGTSGNAPQDTPHLHFAIFRLSEKKQWWQGTPIDPYDVLR